MYDRTKHYFVDYSLKIVVKCDYFGNYHTFLYFFSDNGSSIKKNISKDIQQKN